MKLPGVSISKIKGFTLLKLIMVIGILALLIIISLPLAINFYRTRQFDVHLNGGVQALRRAQLKAMSGEGDFSFGLYITSERYILFKGDAYVIRDTVYDEVFDLPDSIQISGLSEVVFSKLRGTPSNTGTITLTIDNKSETINVNEAGRIDY